MDVRLRRLLAEIESSMNRTLRRITLREAVEGKLPKIVPSGESRYLSYADILDLSKIVPEDMRDQVRLPIILTRRVDLGPGVFVIGDEDKYVIELLTGEEKKYLSKPEVKELTSRFPSLIHILIYGSIVE